LERVQNLFFFILFLPARINEQNHFKVSKKKQNILLSPTRLFVPTKESEILFLNHSALDRPARALMAEMGANRAESAEPGPSFDCSGRRGYG
jgi:hypothetical protein